LRGLSTRCSQIAILDLAKAISRKRCKIGGKLVLITNRKSCMSYQLVPNSVTLNDLEQRNGPYFAIFHRVRVCCRRKTVIRPIPPCQNLLLIVSDHISMVFTIIDRVFGQNKRRQ